MASSKATNCPPRRKRRRRRRTRRSQRSAQRPLRCQEEKEERRWRRSPASATDALRCQEEKEETGEEVQPRRDRSLRAKKKKKKDTMEKKSSLGATDLSAAKKKKKTGQEGEEVRDSLSHRGLIAISNFEFLHKRPDAKSGRFVLSPTLTRSASVALLRKRRRRPARYRPAAPLPAWQCQDTQ